MLAPTSPSYAIPARIRGARLLEKAAHDLLHYVELHDHEERIGRLDIADSYAKTQEALIRDAVEALRNVLKDADFKEAHAHLCDALEAVDAEIERRNPPTDNTNDAE